MIKRKRDRLDSMMRRKMPVMVGRMAKDHFQDNFRQGGFVNGGLHPCPKPNAVLGRFRCRQQLWNAALRQETSVQIGRIYTCRLPGKGIQRGGLCTINNWGGEIDVTVTDRMRRFAWAKFYKASGKRKKAGTGERNASNRRSQAERN